MRHLAGQHLPLAAEAFAFTHGKAGLLQAAADKPCGGKGGQRPAGPRQTCHGIEQILGPHVGIFGRGKAVKKPGVHLLVQRIIQLPGQLIDIAKPQIERHPPAVEQQTMAPAEGRRPLRLQLLRPRSQLWPALVRQAEILSLQRIFFKTDEM